MSGTLLHICCAPCSIACIDTLRQEGIEPVGFWYNPNIHPMKEYKMRKNTLVEYAKSIDLKLEIENEYGLRKFIEAVYPNWDNRCATCYALRFEETARYAAEHGYDRFTSTLFVSPYQNHELMRQICEQMAENTVSSICTATFRRASARDRIRRVSLACTCRITAAVFSPRRTAIASAKRRKSRMPRRRKTEIGVFRHNPTEIPRNNRFTNARKTGILYHVLAPVAQLDRALDSDSKGHAFESHRAYHVKPLISWK